MKKIKYLAIGISIILLTFYLYESFIYYKIVDNPFNDYHSDSLVDFHISQNFPDGETVSAKSHNSKTNCLVMEYLSNLTLIPLKESKAEEMLSHKENNTYLTGMLTFNESEQLFFKDIYTDDPTIILISSPLAEFKKEGYYKIENATFDYNYIFDLLSESEGLIEDTNSR